MGARPRQRLRRYGVRCSKLAWIKYLALTIIITNDHKPTETMAQGGRPPLKELQDASFVPLPPAAPSCAGAPALPGAMGPPTQQQPPPRVPCVPPPPTDDEDEGILPPPPFLQQRQEYQQQLNEVPRFTGGVPFASEVAVYGYDPASAAAWKQQQQQQQQYYQQQQPPQQQQPRASAQKPYMDPERHLHPLLVELFEQGVGCAGRQHGGYHHINVKAATRLLEAGCNVEIWLYKGAHSRKSKREEGKAAKDTLGASNVWLVVLHELRTAGSFKHITKWKSLRDLWQRLFLKWQQGWGCNGTARGNSRGSS